MPRGAVRWFNDAKGYGFLVGADDREVFVHYSSILSVGFRSLNAGQLVDYEEEAGPRGPYAVRLSVVADP
jgi:CspA family cold shock protein